MSLREWATFADPQEKESEGPAKVDQEDELDELADP